MEKLISIIVPVYNVADYLPKCLDSILSQTYKNIEVLLVDDGSTDESGAICESCASRDTRVTVVHQANQGQSGARNFGLERIKGDYVSFIDSDDYISPEMMSVLVSNLERYEADWSMVATSVMFPNRQQKDLHIGDANADGVLVTDGREMLHTLLSSDKWRIGAVWNKLYRREIIGDTRFIQADAEDMEFNYHIFSRTKRAVAVDRLMYFWVRRDDSLMQKPLFHARQLQTHLLCLSYVPAEDARLRGGCLKRIYKNLLSTRYWSGRTEAKAEAWAIIDEVYNETRNEMAHNAFIPKYDRMGFMLACRFPWLYAAFLQACEAAAFVMRRGRFSART